MQNEIITFTTRVRLLHQRIIIRQLSLAFGTPILVLAILLLASSPLDVESLRSIGTAVGITTGIITVLLAIVLLLVYGGRYEYTYTLNNDGVEGHPSGKTSRINRVANTLGMLSGKPTVMGSAMLAQARQQESVEWSEIDRVKGNEKDHTLCLYGGAIRRMVVFCGSEHYAESLAYAEAHQTCPRTN